MTLFQAHKGATKSGDMHARRNGLLAVGRIEEHRKEILRVKGDQRLVFDLANDAAEGDSLDAPKTEPSAELAAWLEQVREGLTASDKLPPPSLDAASLEQLRALGYID